ncbi:LacI family DNA-binding transcriptional regulator [Caldicellulosiruptoraceae bacterium PP1]
MSSNSDNSKTIKMKDVAKLANVSPSTVSRVLSNSPFVKDETKNRVLQAIEILKYRPNRLGRNLRKLASKMIMVVFPDITNPFFANIIQGVEDIARQKGYYVLLGDTRNDINIEKEFLELGKEKLVDGILLATARVPKEDILNASLHVPLVLACEYIKENNISTVSIDNIKAAFAGTKHLIDLGHRRIAFINGPKKIILSQDRLEGFIKACKEHKIPINNGFIINGDFSIESGYQIMNNLLEMNKKPTAVFSANDQMAVGAIKAIKDKGLKVPDHIAIVGFDDIPLSTVIEPQLTTISQPKYEIGKQAMQLLIEKIEEKNYKNKQIILPHNLIIRKSCGFANFY